MAVSEDKKRMFLLGGTQYHADSSESGQAMHEALVVRLRDNKASNLRRNAD